MRQLLLGPILNYRLLLLVAVLLERRIGGIDHRSILRILGMRQPELSAEGLKWNEQLTAGAWYWGAAGSGEVDPAPSGPLSFPHEHLIPLPCTG